MSAREPLTAAELDAIRGRAEVLAVAWGRRVPDLQAPVQLAAPQVAAEFGARIARDDVPALLAEVDRLAAELADARAELTAREG